MYNLARYKTFDRIIHFTVCAAGTATSKTLQTIL